MLAIKQILSQCWFELWSQLYTFVLTKVVGTFSLTKKKNRFIYFIYLACMSIVTECVVCTTCLHGAPRARKRGMDFLELKLLMVVTPM